MKQHSINKLNNLKDGELFKCYSAFNGFAIYRTNKFHNISYDGTCEKFKNLISDKDKINTLNMFKKILNNPDLKFADKCILELKDGEHCEHLYFHISAIINNNAKIRIAKEIL